MAGDLTLSADAGWLDRHTAAAPPALAERVRPYAAGDAAPWPARLASAGCRALDHVLAHPGDRSVALDLLAADGLITLALLAQAEAAPAELAAFAAGLLVSGPAGP